MTRLAPLAAAALVLVGCGGGGGRATLWITTDMGRHVVLVRRVPAGVTAAQALEREAKVTTRYGGRFVQSIDGISGSLARRHDWFWFVNGLEGDRSAAEYRLHDGDVEWWDYRDWGRSGEHVPVVVGAFPEPFLHGYDGKVRPAYVFDTTHRQRAGARAIARLLHATVLRDGHAPPGANEFLIVARPRGVTTDLRPGGGIAFVCGCDALALARVPGSIRFRYRVLP